MKKIISLVAVIAIALSAQAQIVSSRSTSVTQSKSNFANYNRLYAGFSSLHVSEIYDDGISLSGVALGYLYGISVSSQMPLYVEVGANVQYNAKTQTETYHGYYYDEKSEDKITMLNVTIPVNATYRFDLGNNIIVAPYTGIHVKTNIIGKVKPDGEKSISLFDKDDVDETASRVQVGWQIGGNFSYKALNIGIEYGLDFNKYWKRDHDNVKTSTFLATIGVNF